MATPAGLCQLTGQERGRANINIEQGLPRVRKDSGET